MSGLLSHSILRPFYRTCVRDMELQGDEDVLDFGCGTGGASVLLARELDAGSLTCNDISHPAMHRARRALQECTNVRILPGDIRARCLPNEHFDLIYLGFVLYHIPAAERDGILDELHRLLKRSGRIIIRNPVARKHFTRAHIQNIMRRNGFVEQNSILTRTLMVIPTYVGWYTR